MDRVSDCLSNAQVELRHAGHMANILDACERNTGHRPREAVTLALRHIDEATQWLDRAELALDWESESQALYAASAERASLLQRLGR